MKRELTQLVAESVLASLCIGGSFCKLFVLVLSCLSPAFVGSFFFFPRLTILCSISQRTPEIDIIVLLRIRRGWATLFMELEVRVQVRRQYILNLRMRWFMVICFLMFIKAS